MWTLGPRLQDLLTIEDHTFRDRLVGRFELPRRVESSVMSDNASLFPFAAAGITAFALVATLFFFSDFAAAGETPATANCLCLKGTNSDLRTAPAETSALNESDEIAALESVQLALTEIADGSSYIWHRNHGRLSGVVKPVSSFKDSNGSVCRYAVVVLSNLDITKRTEIVACRLPTGIWQLES
jgi:surface antigen